MPIISSIIRIQQRNFNFNYLSNYQKLWKSYYYNNRNNLTIARGTNNLYKCLHYSKKNISSSSSSSDEDDQKSTVINDNEKCSIKNSGQPDTTAPDPTDIPLIPISHESQVLIPKDNSQPSSEMMLSEDLVPPTNCCMSGCPNCVWLEYVERLTQYYSDPNLGKEKIHEEVEKIGDNNIKVLLIMELKSRGLW